MKNDWVDFRAVKAGISMEMTLAQYGVMLHRLDRCYLRGRCPLPTHLSKSSRQSFIVNTEKNAWACHSASCRGTRVGVAGPRILLGIDNEALPAAFRQVGWQRTAPTEVAAIKAVQHDAILCEGHLHGNAGLHCSKINPVIFHCTSSPPETLVGVVLIWTNSAALS